MVSCWGVDVNLEFGVLGLECWFIEHGVSLCALGVDFDVGVGFDCVHLVAAGRWSMKCCALWFSLAVQ